MVQYKKQSGKLPHGAFLKEWSIECDFNGAWGSAARDTALTGSSLALTFDVPSGSTGGLTLYEAFLEVQKAPSGSNDAAYLSASFETGDGTSLLLPIVTDASTAVTKRSKFAGTGSAVFPLWQDGTGGKPTVTLNGTTDDGATAVDLADFSAGRLVFHVRGTEAE